MEIQETNTIGEIVAANIKTADVFKKHGIDFCCGGGKKIIDVCNKKEIDFDVISSELIQIDQQVQPPTDFNSWKLDFLIDYIENVHHTYVSQNIPLILEYSNKVANVHGESHPEVIEVNQLFIAVAQELAAHMKKEELILFPYVKQLVKSEKEGSVPGTPHFGTVKNPITMMEHEHDNAGDIFKKIAELTSNYTPPEYACNTYRALYAKLEEFENDLHQHVHLENNILFPKTKKLEEELF